MAVGEPAEAELPALVGVLARAFRDNPLNVAVIGSDPARRLACNTHGMRALLPLARRHAALRTARRGSQVLGAIVATPPFAYPLPAPATAARLRLLWGQGWRVASRWSRVFGALDERHPRDGHWYLGTLGVDPEHQRHGVGGRLLRDFAARADADGVPAYLETDRAGNVAFYERAGFEVIEEMRVLGVPVWRMRRPARLRPPGRDG